MKLKFLFFFYVASTIQILSGQAVKAIPTEEEWQTYFYSRKRSIEKKLYQFALVGKIKAYRSDSLKSIYGLEDFKMRGASEVNYVYDSNYFYLDVQGKKMLVYRNNEEIEKRRMERVELNGDSIKYMLFNPDNGLEDIWFSQRIESLPFDEKEKSYFKGMALTFCPSFQGYKVRPVPFCWFSVSDLKRVLDNSEYRWIQLVYYYTKNDNNMMWRRFEQSDNDIYQEINNVRSAYNVYYCDSLMLKKISNSMYGSFFYINRYLRDEQAGIPDLPVLFDHQKKQNISYNQFQTNYYDESVVFIQTDPSNAAIGKDSIIKIPKELYVPNCIEIDSIKFKIKLFNFEVRKSYTSYILYKFSIDADRIRKHNTFPTLFWFFEDYFRWKK